MVSRRDGAILLRQSGWHRGISLFCPWQAWSILGSGLSGTFLLGALMILLIDNYDSFSYNLYQYIGELNPDIKVIRNDELTVDEIANLNPSKIIVSPGPGRPCDAGVCEEVILKLGKRIPLLGICLGHQAICEAFKGKITYAKKLMHGKQSIISLDNESVMFKGIPGKIKAARYHSLAADLDEMPDSLKITARTDDGEVMAVEHKDYPIFGLQFHPESIMTEHGKEILRNFVTY